MLGALAPGVTEAAEFDGSAPIVCAVLEVTECDRGGGCEAVEAADIGLPAFLRVDVGGKALQATDGSGRKTPIHSSTLVKEQERLLLLGERAGARLERGDRPEDGRDDGRDRRPRRRVPGLRRLHSALA